MKDGLTQVKELKDKIHEQYIEIQELNKKIEQYENPEDMTLMFMWCDEKAKDEIKRLNNIIKDLEKYIRSNEWGIDYKHSNCRTHLLEILKGEDNE